jgi:hypothetical protein|tara:strand:+ start:2574 stop:3554 length:981 start_codon:yes stop_codon:yes gene_type:complete
MGFFSKVFKTVTKPFKKIVKGVAKGVRKVGRFLKKGLGKVAKAFGKLGPLGTIALSFMLPGIGSALGSWYAGLGTAGGTIGTFIKTIGTGIQSAASTIGSGVGNVFSSITKGIEYGMNKVGTVFGGKGTAGTTFRNFVSNVTGGVITPSDIANKGSIGGGRIVDTGRGSGFGSAVKPDKVAKVATDTVSKEAAKKGLGQTIKDLGTKIKASPVYDSYKKVSALQAYDYATNPLNLTEAEMADHRRAFALNQSAGMELLQENQLLNQSTLYDRGNQVISTASSMPSTTNYYDHYLTQVYGPSMQGMGMQAAINAPTYGMSFEDYLQN